MRRKETALSVTAASPAVASTAIAATTFKGSALEHAKEIVIDALITAGAGGTLDVYLQRKVAADTWRDWVHFPQVAAGVTARYAVSVNGQGSAITAVGGGSDAIPGVALAANSYANVMPGGEVRIVYVAGVGAAGAGTATITLTPYTDLR